MSQGLACTCAHVITSQKKFCCVTTTCKHGGHAKVEAMYFFRSDSDKGGIQLPVILLTVLGVSPNFRISCVSIKINVNGFQKKG